jgi:hypothetical protein
MYTSLFKLCTNIYFGYVVTCCLQFIMFVRVITARDRAVCCKYYCAAFRLYTCRSPALFTSLSSWFSGLGCSIALIRSLLTLV